MQPSAFFKTTEWDASFEFTTSEENFVDAQDISLFPLEAFRRKRRKQWP